MASLGSLVVKLAAETAQFQADMGRAAQVAGQRMRDIQRDVQRSSAGIRSDIQAIQSGFLGMLGTLGLGLSGAAVLRASDEYTKLTAQLRLATQTGEEFGAAYQNVQRIANSSQTGIAAISTLYARLSNATAQAGVSQEKIAQVTETVALSLKVSGTSAAEASSAMLQLSQAFGAGRLAGEEFRAISESAPHLMRALGESLGVPTGALKEMAKEGKLTTEVLVKAFADPKLIESLRSQAAQMTTLTGALTVLKNNLLTAAGEMDNLAGASTNLAQKILEIANNKEGMKQFFAFVADSALSAAAVVRLFGQSLAVVGAIAAVPFGKGWLESVRAIREGAQEELNSILASTNMFRAALEKAEQSWPANAGPQRPRKTFAAAASEEEIKAAKKAAAERKRIMEQELKEFERSWAMLQQDEQRMLDLGTDAVREAALERVRIFEQQRADMSRSLVAQAQEEIDIIAASEEGKRIARDRARKSEQKALEDFIENEMRRSEDATKRNAEMARELGMTFSSAFEDAIVKGSGFRKILDGIAQDIQRIIIRRMVTEPFANAVAGWGGSIASIGAQIAGAYFGGGATGTWDADDAAMGMIGKRAIGGPVMAGTPYLVGESGREIFVPSTSGTVVPNARPSGRAVTMNFSFNSPVPQDRGTQRQMAREMMVYGQRAARSIG